MSKGEGGESFGFAPHGRLGQQDAQRFPRAHVDEKQRVTKEPVISSSSPSWAWLLVGVLLGSGGTLITSSFWMQGSYVNPSVAMDPGPAAAQAETGNRAALETATAEAALETKPADDGVQVAALTRGEDEDGAGAGLARQTDSAGNASKPTTETAASSRQGEARPTTNGEALLISNNKPDHAASPEPSTAKNSNGSVAVSEADLEAIEETVTVAEVDPLEYARARSSTADGARDQENTDRSRAGKTLPAASSSETSDSSNTSLVTGTTGRNWEVQLSGAIADSDQPIVTPRRSNSESINSDDRQRGTIVTANVDPAISENGAPTTPARDTRPAKRIYRVQLAAVDNESAAQVYWLEAQTRLPDVLDGVEPVFDRRLVDDRTFIRVWIGAFDKRAEADNYCGWLKSKGQDCFVTRG